MNKIKEYVERYYTAIKNRDMSYTELATKILDELPNLGLTHRTVRYKVSEEFKALDNKLERVSLMNTTIISNGDATKFGSLNDGYVEQGCGYVEPHKLVLPRGESSYRTQPKKVSSFTRHIIMGCVHFPWHNVRAWEASLNLMSDIRPDGFIGNGDMSDMHNISRHNKGRITIPGMTLSKEYELTNIEIDKLDEVLGEGVDKHWLYGNHEMWYADYMSGLDAAKIGEQAILSPKVALRLEERGYAVQTNYKTAYVVLGDTEVHHGTYVTKHAAAKHAETMRRNNVFNHTHRTGSYHEGNIHVYNLGWMGDKDARVFGYMDRIQKESWTNGFGIVTVDEDNISHVEQVTWKNDRFVYGGKVYKA